MKTFHWIFLPALVAMLSSTALSETIYKTMDKNGAPVFSDERTPGAEKIKVEPNVVDVDIPDMPFHTPPTSHPKVMHTGKQNHTNNNQVDAYPDVYPRGTANAGNLKRKIQNKTNGEGIKRPIARPVARPAARAGGHR